MVSVQTLPSAASHALVQGANDPAQSLLCSRESCGSVANCSMHSSDACAHGFEALHGYAAPILWLNAAWATVGCASAARRRGMRARRFRTPRAGGGARGGRRGAGHAPRATLTPPSKSAVLQLALCMATRGCGVDHRYTARAFRNRRPALVSVRARAVSRRAAAVCMAAA